MAQTLKDFNLMATAPSYDRLVALIMKHYYYDEPPTFIKEGDSKFLRMVTPGGKITDSYMINHKGRWKLGWFMTKMSGGLYSAEKYNDRYMVYDKAGNRHHILWSGGKIYYDRPFSAADTAFITQQVGETIAKREAWRMANPNYRMFGKKKHGIKVVHYGRKATQGKNLIIDMWHGKKAKPSFDKGYDFDYSYYSNHWSNPHLPYKGNIYYNGKSVGDFQADTLQRMEKFMKRATIIRRPAKLAGKKKTIYNVGYYRQVGRNNILSVSELMDKKPTKAFLENEIKKGGYSHATVMIQPRSLLSAATLKQLGF